MNLSNLAQTAKFAIGRGGLVLKKYSPEILTAAGVVGTVGATVLACKGRGYFGRVQEEVESYQRRPRWRD